MMEKNTFTILLVVLFYGVYLCHALAIPDSADERFSTCSLCHQIVDKTSSTILKSNGREEVGVQAMVQFCQLLTRPSELQSCSEFVENFGLTVVDYVLSGQGTKQVCANIQACYAENFVAEPHVINEVGIESEMQQNLPETQQNLSETGGFKADARCELCKFFVQLLDSSLAEEKTLATINGTLMAICNSLTQPLLKSVCLALDSQVITLFEQGLDPSTSCQKTNFCPASIPADINVSGIEGLTCDMCNILIEDIAIHANVMSEELSEFCLAFQVCDSGTGQMAADTFNTFHHNPGDSLGCEICEFLINMLDQYIANNKSEAAINATVFKLCNDLPATFQPVCFSLAPAVVSALARGLDPATACTDIKLCTGQSELNQLIPQTRPQHDEIEASLGCEICEFLIDTADQYLQNNKSEAAINATLYKLCNDLPDTFQSFCFSYAPMIVSLLSKGFDPQKVCTEIKLCTGSDESAEHTVSPEHQSQKDHDQISLGCEICEFLIDTADQYLQNNKSEAAINATLYKLCNDLPSTFQPLCIAYVPQIVAALAQGLDPQKVCTEVKLCTGNSTSSSHSHNKPQATAQIKASLGCEICEFLIDTADQYLQNNKSEAAINATLYKLCNDLPSTFQPLCIAYVPQIVAALAKGLDPQKVCTEVKLCTGNGTSTSRTQNKLQSKVQIKVTSFECDMCEFVVANADAYLKNKNFTPAEANNTLYALCDNIPASFRSYCYSIVPKLVTVLVNGVDPVKACEEIKLCSGNLQKKVQRRKMSRRLPLKQQAASLECELCEFVVMEVDTYLKNRNSTPAEVNNTVYQLCQDLPTTFQSFCYYYAPNIVSVVVNGVDPQQACTEIRLCSGAQDNKIKKIQAASLECELCEFVVMEVDSYLKNKNFTPAEVNNTVYQLCQELPATFQNFCYQYAPMIVQVIVNGVDPKQACTEIKLCTGRFVPGKPAKTAVQSKAASLECELCEFVVMEVDAYLKNKNFTPAEVNNTVYQLCQELPATFQNFCYQYAPMIVQVIVNGVDPKQACTEIKLCTGRFVPGKPAKTAVQSKFSENCVICKTIVNILNDYLKDLGLSAADFNRTVYQACSQLPYSFRTICYSQAPAIVSMLMEGLDPKLICIELNVCDGPQQLLPFLKGLSQLKSLECEACKVAFATLDDDLYKNEDKVKQLLENICHRLPPPTDQKCLDYVDNNFDQLWEKFLRKVLSPDGVCKLLKLCP
ncbi:uncharacterized protein LOC135461774 [Liolophura sinensis]|uniref:uncharacterized protein LOC135461774 n=1 Tax=Liolophura sinensis TaxID=3198878 RepID=UPI00315877C4